MFGIGIYGKFKHLICQIFSIFQESQTKVRTKAKTKTKTKIKIKSKQNTQKKRTTILVVEDNADLQEGLKMILQDLPYKVAMTSNGREGLEYLRKHEKKIAFILLNIAMPVMDGVKFLSIVKRDSELKEIPIIIQSGSCDKIIQKCMAKGASDYIQKPYTKEMLYASIKKLNIKREGKYGKRIMQGACTGILFF